MRVDHEISKAEYRLERLRGKLIHLAATKQVDTKDEGYIFVETNIEEAMTYINRVNLFLLLYLNLKSKKDSSRILKMEDHLSTNPKLKKIYDKFERTLFKFFFKRNKFDIIILQVFFKISSKMGFKIRNGDAFFDKLCLNFKYTFFFTEERLISY